MPKLRDAYGNSKSSGYTIDFFELTAPGAKSAMLASPFFSTYDPIERLTKRGCEVKLIVRLCSVTPPTVVAKAMADPLVTLRFFTSRAFHAKLYIVDDQAMVGSANLTSAGLMSNREVSIVVRKDRDAAFDELPGLFDLFWSHAGAMTPDILAAYQTAFRQIGNPKEEAEFEQYLTKLVGKVDPPSAMAGSDVMSKRRSFLEQLRRKYDEQVIPAFREVRDIMLESGLRRAEFADGDIEIELNRFLGWTRLIHAPGETWKQSTLVAQPERRERTLTYLRDWAQVGDTRAGDMYYAEEEFGNIARLREGFASVSTIEAMDYDQMFDTLCGCHAFYDMLRFVSGGLPGLKTDFAKRNTLPEIKATLAYLLHGDGLMLERAYDCIFDEKWKLGRFGENCVMELVGWMTPDRPPVNGRTLKALRFIGHDIAG
ncbi:phospholipase D family protein [Sphingopyxis sp.]|uniref:phospholipase D family protein n=1 Tax=Sphingopyxis sp. TaxID=1908224 RepID=UPI00260B0C0C|nr:phospholipase D family protein [Sphingopyxis sp.]MCW0196809.1 phospholipase D family protein [Sphingopyxis sp.]